jgi:TRAP-type C4-dicarboxylate transport system permease small subunit
MTPDNAWVTRAGWAGTKSGLRLRSLALIGLVAAVATLAFVSMAFGEWALAIGGATSTAVAAFVLIRRPGNRVGVYLLGFGFASVMTDFVIAANDAGGLPLPRATAVLEASVFVLVGTFWSALMLVYPTGIAPGRWRWILRLVLSIGAVGFVSGVIWASVRPFDRLITEITSSDNMSNPAEFASAITFMVFLPLSLASLFVRYRRAQHVERLQIRWLMVAAFFLIVSTAIQNILEAFDSPIAIISTGIAFVALPVAIGIAVLRYRLYDIDRIITRTASYATVIGLLLIVYALVVTLLSQLVPVEGDFAVVVSTLTAATFFHPLRKRVQKVIDRRFNRTHYDAQRELAAFANRVRDTTDIAVMESDVRSLIDRTMQPSTTAIWISEPNTT